MHMSLQSSLNSLKFKCEALIKLTTCTGLSTTDINEFGILLTINACFNKVQWSLVYILNTVFVLCTVGSTIRRHIW
jgi:hypothetical protein